MGYRVYILRFVGVFGVLTLLGLSTVSGALAQEATPTFEPLFPTRTPQPTQYFECPQDDRLPGGWGTSTPDPIWLTTCRHCLPSNSYPTSTPAPWMQTATARAPTATPGVTITPEMATPFPPLNNYPTMGLRWRYTSDPLEPVISKTLGGEISCGATACGIQLGWPNVGVYYLDGNAVSGPEVTINYTYSCRGVYISSLQRSDATYQIYDAYGPIYLQNENIPNNTTDLNRDYQLTRSRSGFHIYHGAPGVHLFNLGSKISGSIECTVTASLYSFQVDPTPTPSPTPSPTPTLDPNSYCTNVKPALGSGGGLDDLMPTIRVGPSTCGIGWGQTTISLSSLNWLTGASWEDIVIPGLDICYRTITFGSLNLFGLAISLDALSNIAAAAFVFRFFRSMMG